MDFTLLLLRFLSQRPELTTPNRPRFNILYAKTKIKVNKKRRNIKMPKKYEAPFYTDTQIEDMPNSDPRLRHPYNDEDLTYDGIKRQGVD
jgi:hypothetical protein